MRAPVKGDLVRVVYGQLLNTTDKQHCDNHGYLWIVNHVGRAGQTYRCRSLATGYEAVWFVDEVETYDETQDAT